MSKDQQSFEEMMQELENIVQKLDNETVSLEESLGVISTWYETFSNM